MDNLHNVNKTVLPNGIAVISEYVDFVRSAAIGIWVTAGARDEIPENNGIAHFMEHMVFKGTQNRAPYEIANAIESYGGQLNAFTGKELTCFYARVLDENIGDAIEVLSDILLYPLFRPEDIEREKSVVLEELSDVQDTPSDFIHELFVSQLFPDHPLGYNILGTRESIQGFSATRIREFTQQYYLPERMVISVAGHVDHDTLVKTVEQNLGQFQPDVRNPREFTPPATPVPGEKIHTNGHQQSHVVTGLRTFSYSDDRRYALLVLNTILSGGMSSRLFQNIRERYGFAYSIYSFLDFYSDDGLFGVYVGTEKTKLNFMRGKIIDELNKLKEITIPEDELQKVRSQVEGSLVLSQENMFNRMNRLAKQDIYYNQFQSLDDYIRKVEQVTTNDVRSLAVELFNPDKFVTTILQPEPIS